MKEDFNETLEILLDTENSEVLFTVSAENVFNLLLNTTGMLINGFLVYFVLRFKKMWTRENVCLINWAICDIFYWLLGASIYVTLRMTTFHVEGWLYNLVNLQLVFTEAGACFMFLLTLTCIFKCSVKCLSVIFLVIWVTVFIFSLVMACVYVNALVVHLFSAIFLVLLIAILISLILYFIKVIQKKHTVNQKYRMTIVGFYEICRVVRLTAFILQHAVPAAPRFFCTSLFYLSFMHPIINAILLIILDDNYNICFRNFYKCSNKFIEDKLNTKTEDELGLNTNFQHTPLDA